MTQVAEPDLDALQHALSGRYVLGRRLGRGGMGIVYLARELRLERLVAIKLLPPARAADPVARARFLHEARTAAQLSHPHIIPIFTVDQVGEFVFYAMAYVEGETLGQRIGRAGPLAPTEGARVLREVAWALAYAHVRGVVHRDVKPDNILLEAGTGRALVADFGIARVGLGTGATGPQEVVGTAEFMSPEQAAGRPADARSDLYSLGVVGYYALSGRLPFTGQDSHALLVRHISEPAPRLAGVAPWVPRRLAQAIDCCLAKDPTARFPTGGALAEAIAPFVTAHSAPAIAVRAFLRESDHLSGAARLYVLIVGGVFLPFVLDTVLPLDSLEATLPLAAFAGAMLLLPAGFLVGRVRRFLRSGHDVEDLVEALHAEHVRRCEELAFVYGTGPSRLERLMHAAVYATLGVAALAVGLATDGSRLSALPGLPVFAAAAGGAALLAAMIARARTEQRTDPRGERRLRFWRSRLSGWVFRLAGIGLSRARPATAPLESPGDFAIGVVGDRFFYGAPGPVGPPSRTAPLTPPTPA